MGKEFQLTDLRHALAGDYNIAIFDMVGLHDEVIVDQLVFENKAHWKRQKQEIARRAKELKAEVLIIKENGLFKICFYLKSTNLEIPCLSNHPICLN
jgi:hypothetical protein